MKLPLLVRAAVTRDETAASYKFAGICPAELSQEDQLALVTSLLRISNRDPNETALLYELLQIGDKKLFLDHLDSASDKMTLMRLWLVCCIDHKITLADAVVDRIRVSIAGEPGGRLPSTAGEDQKAILTLLDKHYGAMAKFAGAVSDFFKRKPENQSPTSTASMPVAVAMLVSDANNLTFMKRI